MPTVDLGRYYSKVIFNMTEMVKEHCAYIGTEDWKMEIHPEAVMKGAFSLEIPELSNENPSDSNFTRIS